MQAISYTRAQHSGAWSARVTVKTKPVFSFEAIYRNIAHLAEMTARWEGFFALRGIAPLRLSYERIDADIVGVIKEIADFLGVAVGAFDIPRKEYQRDDVSLAWRAQFIATLESK
jgi:LPS sulfotransferase NodH